ncbi:MAG: HAD family phosphatase [Bacteroidota bacterium]
MVRNIVFDLGNVLISFRPSEYLEKSSFPPEKHKTILSDIFGSREWLLLDEGKITTPEAIESIAGRSSLQRAEIERIFNERILIFHSLDLNAKILPELKKQGFRLYYLSNFPADIFDEVKNGYGFFRHFEGGIISAHVKCSKPDPVIFRIFFDKFKLTSEECFYIDDTESNVSSAISSGMRGFCTFGSKDISGELIKKINSIAPGFIPGS